jgi:hypothetical protein
MISTQNVMSTLIKSTGIATVFFWILFSSSEGWENEYLMFIMISTIPIFIICALAYSITILPFILVENSKSTKKQVFKKYFPYYSIFAFGICSYFIIISSFDSAVVCFFTTAFFTSISAWIILLKPEKNENI